MKSRQSGQAQDIDSDVTGLGRLPWFQRTFVHVSGRDTERSNMGNMRKLDETVWWGAGRRSIRLPLAEWISHLGITNSIASIRDVSVTTWELMRRRLPECCKLDAV